MKGKIVSKILLIDLEIAPTYAAIWKLFKENISLDQIKDDWFIMSYSAKWFDDDVVVYNDCRNDIGNDKKLLEEIHDLLGFADIVVAHNVAFDIPKIRARMVINEMLPPAPFKTYCTLMAAKKIFSFTSNKLQYLSEKLTKLKHAKYPGFLLWKECMQGNEEAWQEMKEYNERDVLALEAVYKKLKAWDNRHPNVNVTSESESMACPSCGSIHVVKRGYYHTNTGEYQRYRCSDCGRWSRSRYTLNSVNKRRSLLV